jgi:hypothetical protein
MIGGRSTTRSHAMLLPRRARPSFLVPFTFACVVFAGAATAADAPPASAKSVLTPAQLRECLAQKERLHKDNDAALKVKVEIDADKAEIARIGSAVDALTPTLDRTNADAVASYNAKVEERNKLIDSYQAKANAFNKDAESLNAGRAAYANTCESRRYDDRDLNDLQKKKK